jgi:hypothetical protein
MLPAARGTGRLRFGSLALPCPCNTAGLI